MSGYGWGYSIPKRIASGIRTSVTVVRSPAAVTSGYRSAAGRDAYL